MRVLVGVDDSAYSQAALNWIEGMAWPAGTEFIVLCAARTPIYAYPMTDLPTPGYTKEILEEQQKLHEEVAKRFERPLRERGFETRALAPQADPRTALVDTATSEHADLIVVGSHGRTGITKLVLGSVASHVVTHAPCSVVVVRLPARVA